MTSREAREKVEDELNRNGVEIRDIFVIRGKSYRPESPEFVSYDFFCNACSALLFKILLIQFFGFLEFKSRFLIWLL